MDAPPVPQVNLSKLFKLRDDLYEDLSTHCLGSKVDAGSLPVIGKRIAAVLRVAAYNLPAVADSCRELHGQILTEKSLFKLAWRCAANVGSLRSGRAVLAWNKDTVGSLEWLYVWIISARATENRKHEPMVRLEMQILNGSPAGESAVGYLPSKFVSFLASRIGFSKNRRTGKYPYKSCEELTQLFFAGLSNAAWTLRRPRFDLFEFPSNLLSRNREVLKARARIGFKCPYGYGHSCHRCPVGYSGETACPAAVRETTLVFDSCTSCGHPALCCPDESKIPVEKTCANCRYFADKNEQMRRT